MLAMAAAAGNAQFFVEGSIGAQYWGQSSSFDGTATSQPSSHYLSISPLIGRRMNEKLALGVSASLVRRTERYMTLDSNTGEEVLYERKTPGWNLSIFDRYTLWDKKKFSILLESSFFFGANNAIEKRGVTTLSNQIRTSIGVQAFPLILYDLSDRFSIRFSVDFLRLDLYALIVNNKETGKKTKSAHFELNGQSTILYSLGGFRIGIIYHFKKSDK